ncbi:tRNA uridine-5-carboxymethylaminomethyl(34) synthesis GTPase MnmE [Rhizobium sp.]
MTTRDTIFALSSGGLPSGVAVVRLSGPRALSVAEMLAGRLPAARQSSLRWIRTRNGDPIDQGLVLIFPAPSSFTGEDCIEFQLHGGRAVVAALLRELESVDGLRHAEAGEFSRRAFDNGRLDLVEIEGLSDLIAADTEMQRRLALEQSSGMLSRLYGGWAEQLTRIRALIEAELDFPDEDDVPGAVSDRLWPQLAVLRDEMKQHVAGAAASEIVRDGFKVAIVGAPNAGKSSLLNALAKREVAIVTDIAGTTRDVLGIDLDIGGYLVHLMDTAGIRETEDVVEQEGVRRAFRSMEQADLVLMLRSSEPGLEMSDLETDRRFVTIQSKADLLDAAAPRAEGILYLSAKTGEGFDSLTKRIASEIESSTSRAGGLAPARQRQADYLRRSIADIEQSLQNPAIALELKAEYLRLASHSLGKITGRVDVEDLLDVIFSEFCIGK